MFNLHVVCLEVEGMEGGVQASRPASCCRTSLGFNICKGFKMNSGQFPAIFVAAKNMFDGKLGHLHLCLW